MRFRTKLIAPHTVRYSYYLSFLFRVAHWLYCHAEGIVEHQWDEEYENGMGNEA